MRVVILILFIIYSVLLYGVVYDVPKVKQVNVKYSKVLYNQQVQKLTTHIKLCDHKMRGKHIYIFNNNTLYVSYLVIKEKGSNITSFVVEEWYNNKWNVIFQGGKIGENYIVKFDNVINGNIRFKVLKSFKIPTIESFQIYTKK